MSDTDLLVRVAKNLADGHVGPRYTPEGLLAVHDRVLAAVTGVSVIDVRTRRRESGWEATVEELTLTVVELLRIWARDDNAPLDVSRVTGISRAPRPAPRRTALTNVVQAALREQVLL